VPRHNLRFSFLEGKFAICRLPHEAAIPPWALDGGFTSVTRAPDELSIVCRENRIPAGVQAETDWVCFKLEGPFPFSQTGILASFVQPLSDNAIPIFAISTYDTDYVLIKEAFQGRALGALKAAGHELISR